MGGLLAFRIGNYETIAKREQFIFLCEQLKNHYRDSDEFGVFVGNYNIGCELDAIFIKKDAIISIEFKNYGGNVVANENGEWTTDSVTIKGSSLKTTLQQARINHTTIKRKLKALGVDSKQIKDVPHLIVFNQPINLDNRLSEKEKSWLHITDNNHFIKKLYDITCPHTNIGTFDIIEYTELLNLNSFFLKEFSNATYEYESKEKDKKQDEISPKDEVLKFDTLVIEDENSISLLEFVQQIIKSSLKLNQFVVKVLDGAKVISMFTTYGIKITHKYVVTISADDIGKYCAKLSKFTNHNITMISPSIIFWEEGEILSAGRDATFKVSKIQHKERTLKTSSNINFRKSKTTLPHWLDKKIFNNCKAIYAPEHERFEYNLDLNKKELKVYLGTYFPRSYAEMFCIVDNFMQNNYIKTVLEQNEINVLDCGCGTGGEILGLITAIGKYLPYARINVTAVDGNESALLLLKDVLEEYPNINVQIELTMLCQTLNTATDLERLAHGKKEYQFVLCDKMVCELISNDVLPSNAYAIMAKTLSSHLHENGFLIILDVTTKDKHTGYFYPQLMNNYINDFVRKNKTIETLLPLSCACYGNCKDLCFMQQTFFVSHSHKSNDESKVCYRVLCRKDFKKAIIHGINTDDLIHVIHPIKYKQKDESAICRQSKNNKITIDTFNINI